MTESRSAAKQVLAVGEPAGALVIGALLAATTYFLCALLFGARLAIVVAVAALAVAVLRRVSSAAVGFGVAAVLAGVGLRPSTSALAGAAALFGVALALFSRAWMLRRIESADATPARSLVATDLRNS